MKKAQRLFQSKVLARLLNNSIRALTGISSASISVSESRRLL